jgi:hypothetical protein
VGPEQVTVTMPIHPLNGLELKLVGMRLDHLARRQTLIAEVADGSHIVLPVDWTDRGSPWVAPKLGGRDVRLCARGLLALARAIETGLRQKLGPSPKTCSAFTEAEHASKSDVSSRDQAGCVGGPDVDDAARPARRVGKSAAQGAQRKRGRR